MSEAFLDDLVERYSHRDDVRLVARNVHYKRGEMDVYIEFSDGRRRYLEYKCTDSHRSRRDAKAQIRRAINYGAADEGIYVSHRDGHLVARRYKV